MGSNCVLLLSRCLTSKPSGLMCRNAELPVSAETGREISDSHPRVIQQVHWEIKSRWVQAWQPQCWLRCPFAKWQYHDISSQKSSAKMNQLMAREILFCSGKHYRKSHEENLSGFKEHGINQEYTGKQQIEIGACQLRHVFLVQSMSWRTSNTWRNPKYVCTIKDKIKGS